MMHEVAKSSTGGVNSPILAFLPSAARICIYVTCGLVIIAAMAILALDYFTHAAFTARLPRLTFDCEWAGLAAFGISWLTASKVFPGVASQSERFSPFG